MLPVFLVRVMFLDGKVSATIVNLRNMANDIGNVTKAQNEMLNRWHIPHVVQYSDVEYNILQI